MAAAIPLAIGAVAGGISAADEERQTARFNRAAAEGNKFADVTGHRTALRRGPAGGVFGGALKGASTFGGLASAFGGGGGAASKLGSAQGVADVGGESFVKNLPSGGFVGGQAVQDIPAFGAGQSSSFNALGGRNFGTFS